MTFKQGPAYAELTNGTEFTASCSGCPMNLIGANVVVTYIGPT